MKYEDFDFSKLVWDQYICNSLYRFAPGTKIGMLTVTRLLGVVRGYDPDGSIRNKIYYECKCDCGNKTVNREDDLKTVLRGSRNTISCGCYRTATIVKAATGPNRANFKKNTYGQDDPAVGVYRGIRNRVHWKDHPKYHRYGGRGITICPEWDDLENGGSDKFCDWMYNVAGYTKDMGSDVSIDRFDNDGPYSPDNCHLALNRGQGNNRTSQNVYFNWYEQKYTQSDLAYRFGKNRDRVGEKIKEGKPLHEALLAPNFKSKYDRKAALEASPNGLIVTPRAFVIQPFRFVDHCEIDPRNHWRKSDDPNRQTCPTDKAYEQTLNVLAEKIRKAERDNGHSIKPFEFVENATTDFLAYSFMPSTEYNF